MVSLYKVNLELITRPWKDPLLVVGSGEDEHWDFLFGTSELLKELVVFK